MGVYIWLIICLYLLIHIDLQKGQRSCCKSEGRNEEGWGSHEKDCC